MEVMMLNDAQMKKMQPWLVRASAGVARVEFMLIGLLMVAIFAFLMLNVVSRAVGSPVIWVDEAAVFLMIWVAFFGASLALAKREHLAVTLLSDMLNGRIRIFLSLLVDASLFAFFAIFAVILWFWFDPVTLWKAGSFAAFSSETFNFIYQEPTVTLGLPKLWFWLILPIFCLTGLVHTAAQLMRPRGDAQ
jgi:TRAP-type C4-dicarboxylate transport system permease small subunit